MLRPRHSSLEVVIRIRSAAGWVEAEQTIRGDRVELCSYFPSGKHSAQPMEISLEHYIEEIEKLRDEG